MWVLLLHIGVEVKGQKCEIIKCNNDSIYFLYKELIWDRCNKLKRTLVKRDEEQSVQVQEELSTAIAKEGLDGSATREWECKQ